MTAILKAGDLTADELRQQIQELALPEADAGRLRIWAEAPDGWALAAWSGLAGKVPWCASGRTAETLSAHECLSRATAGRLFAPSGELRWRVIPSLGDRCCRVVFLGKTDWLPGRLRPRTELGGLTSSSDGFILWGQQTRHSPGEWIELRIPHRFRYPVQTATPSGDGERVGVRVRVEVWSDGIGEPHFVRLCDLEPYTVTEGGA